MDAIKVNRIGNMISGSCNGVPYSVAYTDVKWQLMKELENKARNATTIAELKYLVDQFQVLTQENYGDFVETKSPYIKVNKDNNKFYLQYNGVISNKAMPNDLAKKIILAVEKNVDILPLVKMWVRFLHNPNYTDKKAEKLVWYISVKYTNEDRVRYLMDKNGLSEVVAYEFATTNQVAITQEGLLVGYKSSYEITDRFKDSNVKLLGQKQLIDPDTGLIVYDQTRYDENRIFEPAHQHSSGNAFYSGTYLGHIIRVGRVHYLPRWDQVNCNDDVRNKPGLHCGGLNYIKGYQNAGTITHNIFVDPMHIGAIVGVGQGLDGAMRVKQYFVFSAFNGVNKSLYHSSTYAQWSEQEQSKMINDAVNKKFIGN
jgi:hypothetical protein